ncbi:hypothetical protein AMTRI_Chr06g175790 [Amborella trichopoda]
MMPPFLPLPLKQPPLETPSTFAVNEEEINAFEFKVLYQKPVPCMREKDACLQCYKEHSKDNPLKYVDVVNAFTDCARRAREQQQQEVV